MTEWNIWCIKNTMMRLRNFNKTLTTQLKLVNSIIRSSCLIQMLIEITITSWESTPVPNIIIDFGSPSSMALISDLSIIFSNSLFKEYHINIHESIRKIKERHGMRRIRFNYLVPTSSWAMILLTMKWIYIQLLTLSQTSEDYIIPS